MQFGPIINAEFGLKNDLVLNTHVRLPVLGLLTYVVNYHNDGLDNLGAAFGAYTREYTDLSYGIYDNEPRRGVSVTPFGMLEVTLGKEF